MEKQSRFDAVQFDSLSSNKQARIKGQFLLVEDMVNDALVDGRAKSIAMTKLEEAYMWIGKALRDEQAGRKNG